MNGVAPLATWISGEFLEGICCPPGVATKNIADLLGIVAILPLQAHDQIELFFTLHHLGRHIAADTRLDQGVDIRDIQTVAGDLSAVDGDGQAGLPQFLHQSDVADAAHLLQDLFDGECHFFCSTFRSEPNTLTARALLQSGFRFVHRILGRLGVVEDDAGKGRQLLIHGLDQRRLGAVGAGPFGVRLKTHEKLDVEEAGGIGAVIGPAQLPRTRW